MTAPEHTTDATPLPEGRFEGRQAFQQLVRDALACAAREGWTEMVLSDATFEDWPLGEREVAASLQAWSTRGRRMTLLARHYDAVVRLHARFVTWRSTWGHLIECHACMAADPLELPSAIWSPSWVLQRQDPVRSSGHTGREPSRRLLLKESLTEWIGRGTPAFPASTLGL